MAKEKAKAKKKATRAKKKVSKKKLRVKSRVLKGKTKKKKIVSMASWNGMKFKVSAHEAAMMESLEIKDTYSDEYDDKGKKVGRELTTFSVKVTYFTPVAGSWKDARSAMQKWRDAIGKEAFFYLNGSKLFKRKCKLLEVSSGGMRFTNDGQVVSVELDLGFRWARTKAQDKAAKKSSKSGTKKKSKGGKTSSKKKKASSTGGYDGGKMSWPLPGHKHISSNYGWRTCPFHGREFHTGIDIPAPSGTMILAAAPGKVVFAGYTGGFGNCVILHHDPKSVWTLYAHCTTVLAKKGEKVKTGQKIAKVGSTGSSTGNHLHFEVRAGSNSSKKHTSPWKYVSK